MAITYKKWEKMNPEKHNIEDFTGAIWLVEKKVVGGIFPAFILKHSRLASGVYCFAPTPDNCQTGILNKDGKMVLNLNHKKTKIVSK